MAIIRESANPSNSACRTDAERIEHVRGLVSRIAGLLGVGGASVRVADDLKPGCRLTSSGIELMVNYKMNEEVARRTAPDGEIALEDVPLGIGERRRMGVKSKVSLHDVDLITSCRIAMRARDFLDPTFAHVPFGSSSLTPASQRYLESAIDEMAADLRALRLPFVAQRFDAYVSRQELHFMQGLPLQQQYMKTLRLLIVENRPEIMVKPQITRALGTLGHMNPLVGELKALLSDETLNYRQRQIRARALIEVPFSKMAKLDEEGFSYYEMAHLFDNEESYAPSKSAAEDELFELEEFESALRADKKLETVNEKNIDQLIADTGEAAMPDDPAPSLHLPGLGDETGALVFERALAEDYDRVITEGDAVIDDLADLLIRIAQPQEFLTVPRYDPKRASAGARLNPHALVDAHIQLQTGTNRSVWQRVRREERFQSRAFNGLDVLLLVDVSFSMTGERAHYAAVTATYLLEGLQRAYERCRATYGAGTVDVRTQLLAFGESWAELTPIATVQDERDKKSAFRAIEFPNSNQTIIGGALRHVQRCARLAPDRELLCLVVSDGLFADNLRARKTALDMPANVYLGHVNIGQFGGVPLSENYESISNPAKLPEKLTAILQHRLEDERG